MKNYHVILKSGHVIRVQAEDCTVEWDTVTGKMKGYVFDNTQPGTWFWVDVSEIAAIVKVKK